MIVEGKVIDLITDNATFTATEFKEGEENDQAAIDFFAGGNSIDIPEAEIRWRRRTSDSRSERKDIVLFETGLNLVEAVNGLLIL